MSINFIGAVWDSGLYDGPRLLMMLALADHADADGWCFPNYDTLALKIRRNVKTVYRVLAELESDGALKRLDGRIGICEPHILEEVKRRAESRRAKSPAEQPDPALNSEKAPAAPGTEPASTILNSENGVLDNETGILNSENELLNSENGILNSETPILNFETPFFIDPSSDPSITRQEPAAAPAAAEPAAPAAAAADPLQPILDWLGFDGDLTPKERAGLDQASLLAWAYRAKLKQAERGHGLTNPIAWVRSQWRNGTQPRADLLRLARAWLLLDDDTRARLLGRLEWANDYGADPGTGLEDDFPDIPARAAAAVYTATNGQLAPPALSPAAPICPTDRSAAPPPSRPIVDRSVPQTEPATRFWREVLAELEMQMTKSTYSAWLKGTTATLDGDELTVHVRNHYAVDWLSNRLHDLITRTVTAVAGRPITVYYLALEMQEAHP